MCETGLCKMPGADATSTPSEATVNQDISEQAVVQPSKSLCGNGSLDKSLTKGPGKDRRSYLEF